MYDHSEKGRQLKKENNKLQEEKAILDKIRKNRSPSLLKAIRWRNSGSVLVGISLMLLLGGPFYLYIRETVNNPGKNLAGIPDFWLVYAGLAIGVILLLIALFIAWKDMQQVTGWVTSLPFKFSNHYLNFISTTFSTTSKHSGTRYADAGFTLEFEDPVDTELLQNSAAGITGKEFQLEADFFEVEVEKEPIEPQMDISDEELDAIEAEMDKESNTDIFESDDPPKEAQKVKLLGHFINGMAFHKFFVTYCNDVLLPLHQKNKILSVMLINEDDLDFMDFS
ncbi:MAG: hypothetical protein FJY10_04645 [Bacteroidetes bacterium]|nr:hypothetical protein [Bacteroidota bacterium]